MTANGRHPLAGLAVLTLVALGLRTIAANNGLWIDEIFSLVDSFRRPLGELVTSYPGDTQHPLYSLLAHLSLRLFGESPWSIRLPSILFGAASVPLLYLLGRELVARREALAAAALLAVSYHHIWFSQNARGYVLLAWCAMAGTWLLLRLLATGRRRHALGYALVTALGAYTHLTMVFLAVGQAAAIVVHLALGGDRAARRRQLGAVVTAFLLAAAGTVSLYAPALPQVVDHFLNRPSQLVGVSTPGWAVIESVRVLAAGFGAGRPLLGLTVIAAGGVVLGAGFVSYLRRQPVATMLFAFPGFSILAGALLARGTMYPRFFFALAGFGILIGVRGVFALSEWMAHRLGRTEPVGVRLAVLVVGLAVALSLFSLAPNYRYPKQDFVGALQQIEDSRQPGDTAAVTGVTDFAFRRYLGRDWPAIATPGDLAALRRDRAVWIAWAFPRYLAAATPEILATLEQDCTRRSTFRGTVGGGDVHVCRLEQLP